MARRSDEAYWDDDGESYRLAAIAEAEQTLDALKGKGKGKGKKGIGKGKGNNGKDKGKDGGKGQPPGKGRGEERVDGARTEGRQCFNCWEYGHLGKDCPLPDRHKDARMLKENPNSDAASIASSARGSAHSLTTARMQLCTMKIQPDESWQTLSRPCRSISELQAAVCRANSAHDLDCCPSF